MCICLAIKVLKYNQFHKYNHIYQLLSLHILMQTITYFCILILGGKMAFLYVCINVVIIVYLICPNCLWVVTQKRIDFLQHLKINVKSLIFLAWCTITTTVEIKVFVYDSYLVSAWILIILICLFPYLPYHVSILVLCSGISKY